MNDQHSKKMSSEIAIKVENLSKCYQYTPLYPVANARFQKTRKGFADVL